MYPLKRPTHLKKALSLLIVMVAFSSKDLQIPNTTFYNSHHMENVSIRMFKFHKQNSYCTVHITMPPLDLRIATVLPGNQETVTKEIFK